MVIPLLDAQASRGFIHQPAKVVVPYQPLLCSVLRFLGWGEKVVKFLVVRVPRYFHIFVSVCMINIDGLV